MKRDGTRIAKQIIQRIARENTTYQLADLREFGIGECPEVGVIHSPQGLRPWAPHTHEQRLEICYLASGQRIYQREGETIYMHGGDLWLNAPGLRHGAGTHPAGPSTFYWFYLEPPGGAKNRWRGFAPRQAVRFWDLLLSRSGGIYHAGESLRPCFEQVLARSARAAEEPWGRERMRTGYHSLLFAILDALDTPARQSLHPGIRRALEMLDAAPMEDKFSLSALAREARLSETYFKVQFQSGVGVSPGRYLLNRRLMAAAQRLVATGEPIVKIAQACGFSSSQHLSTVFQRHFSTTPRRYRLNGGRLPPTALPR